MTLVVLLGLWPHVYVLPLEPESRDAVIWITKSAVGAKAWTKWIFQSDHFVGYRPVTALTYALGTAIGGWSPVPQRVIDLGLHLAAASLLYAVYRRLVPTLSAWGGVAAVAFFALHPVTALVVPHLARRGYSLATALSLAGLWVVLGPATLWRGPVAALLLGAAALSNEGAYVAFPVAAALLWLRTPDRRVAVRDVVPAVLVGLALVAVRFRVLGGLGGYEVEGGSRWASIAASTWEGLLGLEVLRSEVAEVPEALALVLVAVVVGGLVAPLVRRPEALVLLGWVVGLTAVYAPQGVFFPRQLYVALAPFALLLGVAVAEGLAATGARRVVLLGASALATLCVARSSPVLRGPDPVQQASWRAHDRLVHDMDHDLAAVPRNAVVHPVVPHARRPEMEALRAKDTEESRMSGRQALLWHEKTHGFRFGPAVLITRDARLDGPVATLEERPDGPAVVLADGAELSAASIGARVADGVVYPDVTDDQGRPVLLYFHDGLQGRLVPVR